MAGYIAYGLTRSGKAARLLSADLGDLGWIVTDTFGLDDAEAAAARAQDRGALKVVVTP